MPSPATASKTSSSVASSSRKIDDALRAEDRPGDLDDRLQQLAVVLLGAEHSRGDGAAQVVAHRLPPTLVAVR